MDRQKMREAKAKAHAGMKALLDAAAKEERGLTDEEKAQYEEHKAAHAKAVEMLAMLDETDAIGADLATPRPSAATRVPQMAAPVPSAKTKFESIGEFVATVAHNPNDSRLNYQSMEMGEGKRGGFMVPTEFKQELISVAPQEAIVRPRARSLNSGTDAVKTWPALDQSDTSNMYGGIQIKMVGEKKTIGRSDVAMKQVSIQPKKAAAIVPISNDLLRNWTGSSTMISDLLRQGKAAFEDTKFLLGTGVGEPMGVLNAGATVKVDRKTANKVQYDDVVGLLAKAKLGGSLVFVANQSALPQLMTLKDEAGNLIWAPSARDGEPMSLLGRPLLFNERSPQLGSVGDVVLADFGYYWIDDGTGPFIDASEHVEFEKDMTLIRLVFNIDGQPNLSAPITQEGGFKVSPFVALK